jgi:hypothetical protein
VPGLRNHGGDQVSRHGFLNGYEGGREHVRSGRLTRAQKAAVRKHARRNARRSGCATALLLLPWLLLRHRAGEQPDRHDPRPDRLGAHETNAFSSHLTPAAELLRRLNHPTTDKES